MRIISMGRKQILNQNGQALIQSMIALTVVMMILAGAAPLGVTTRKQQAQMQFNSAIQSLNDALVGVVTNPALCAPSSGGAYSWVLPMGSTNPSWAPLFNGQISASALLKPSIPVMVTLPFNNQSNNKQIELTSEFNPLTQSNWSPSQTPTSPLGLGVGQQTYQWNELSDPNQNPNTLYINSLNFVPNLPVAGATPYSPITQSGNTFAVAGTLQFSASVQGSGTLATATRTVASMQISLSNTGAPLGCQVVQSAAATCAEYGGMYDTSINPAQCRFGFVQASCQPGYYISQFHANGSTTCSPLSFTCPVDPNNANNLEAFETIYNGQVFCAPIQYGGGATVQFTTANEPVPQGYGPLNNVDISLSAALPQQVQISVKYAGGALGTDYSAPASPFTVNFPAGTTTVSLAPDVSILSSGNPQPVNVTFEISIPPASASLITLGVPSANTVTIGAPQPCPAVASQQWIDSSSGYTCTGALPSTQSGQQYTASGTNTGGATGSATFTCNGGTWSTPTNATCTAGTGTNDCANGSGTLSLSPSPTCMTFSQASACSNCSGINTHNMSIGQCCVQGPVAQMCPLAQHAYWETTCNTTTAVCPSGYAWNYLGTTPAMVPGASCDSTTYGQTSGQWQCGCKGACPPGGTCMSFGGSGGFCQANPGVNSGRPIYYSSTLNLECVCSQVPCQ